MNVTNQSIDLMAMSEIDFHLGKLQIFTKEVDGSMGMMLRFRKRLQSYRHKDKKVSSYIDNQQMETLAAFQKLKNFKEVARHKMQLLDERKAEIIAEKQKGQRYSTAA
jgi:hypothetical protein